MRLAADGAAFDQELALDGGVPERFGFGIALRGRVFLWRQPSHALQNAGRGGMADAEQAAGAVRDREIAVWNLHLRMRLAT